MFSSYETQGLRDERLWGIWAIWPDGRQWKPIISAFNSPQAFHFMTQLGNGDLVVCDYSNLNNNGFGALYRFPVHAPPGQPDFHSAFMSDAPAIRQTVGAGYEYPLTFPFEPRGIFSLTPFTTGQDEAAPIGAGGVRVGKFTQPSAAPNNDLLVVWTPGPANDLNRPALSGDYARLAADQNANWGYPPIIGNRTWRQTNASRYVRMFQSRRSMLIWKIFGRRLDGWLNSDHPTESTPGVAATLPSGADRNAADLDFTGTAMPPPGSAVPALSEDEKMNFARWVDLGCPINVGQLESVQSGALGWFLDENRPTLAISSPRPNLNAGPLAEIRIGIADAYTGVNAATLSVKADFPVNGRAAGAQLADLATTVAPGIYAIPLSPPLACLTPRHINASVADVQGNVTRANVRFSVAPDALELRQLTRTADRLRLRFFDTQPDRSRRIRYSATLSAPRPSWLVAPVLSEAWNAANECTAEIALPPGITDRAFFVIERGP